MSKNVQEVDRNRNEEEEEEMNQFLREEMQRYDKENYIMCLDRKKEEEEEINQYYEEMQDQETFTKEEFYQLAKSIIAICE